MMQRKSNIKQIASALFENEPQHSRLSGKNLSNGSGEGLKRKGESDDSFVPPRSRSDASSADVHEIRSRGDSLRKGSNALDDEDDTEYFDCEEEERSKRLSVDGPPTKRKNDVNHSNHLISKVQGPSRLRYWDSADHHRTESAGKA